MIDPKVIGIYWLPILRDHRRGRRSARWSRAASGRSSPGTMRATSLRVGMGLAQIGEFSFIIAQLGLTLNVTERLPVPDRRHRQRHHHAADALPDPGVRPARHAARTATRRQRADVVPRGYGSWLEGLSEQPPRRPPGAASCCASGRFRSRLNIVLVSGLFIAARLARRTAEQRFRTDPRYVGGPRAWSG